MRTTYLKYKGKKIIIRSSAIKEDKKEDTQAGKFKSYLNINVKDKKIDTYIKNILKDFKNSNDGIFIQEFVENFEVSGVIFTHHLINLSPYYVINCDFSKKSNLITSGKANPTMQIYNIYKYIYLFY